MISLKEKISKTTKQSEIVFSGVNIESFNTINITENSYRIFQNSNIGIYYVLGDIPDEIGFDKAKQNLMSIGRPFPFGLSVGNRTRDMIEKKITENDLLLFTNKCLRYFHKHYSDYSFEGKISQIYVTIKQKNDLGLNYQNSDGYCCLKLYFKKRNSKSLFDGKIIIKARILSFYKIKTTVSYWLENYGNEVNLPGECIIMTAYDSYLEKITKNLNSERLQDGTSLFSRRIGQLVFSEKFTLYHDVSDRNCWMSPFWDGYGDTVKTDKTIFIKNGIIKKGYSDRRTAEKYGIKNTANAKINLLDLPNTDNLSLRIKATNKCIEDILRGRLAIIPFSLEKTNMNENGDITILVKVGLLTNGEKILGRVPSFSYQTSLFEIFGTNYLGTVKSNKIFNDKVFFYSVQESHCILYH